MSQLTAREQRILDHMRDEIRKKGYPPTVREVCASLGIRSTSTVHKAMNILEKQGYIRKDPSKRRAVEVLTGSGTSGCRRARLRRTSAKWPKKHLTSELIFCI